MLNKIKRKIKDLFIVRFLYATFFYWPIYFISGLFKRDEKIWLVSTFDGFLDNSKYFYIYYQDYLKEKHDIKLIWFAHTTKELKSLNNLGFKNVVLAKSLKGICISLKAKVYISSYGVSDLYVALSNNALQISLWHGVGIKNMSFKSSVEPSTRKAISSNLSKYVYSALYRKFDMFLSTSRLMTEHFSECFNMNKKSFYISTYPRCELLTKEISIVDSFVEQYEPFETKSIVQKMKNHKRCFIYMPTWRDINPNFLTEAGINWHSINEILKSKEYMLILKIHPKSDINGLESFSNILLVNPKLDIYPILPYTDCLITDYSSIYFDYLLTDKNIALFTFDYEEYMSNCRDFAYPYDENMIGHRINNIEEFLKFFENYEEIDFLKYQDKILDIKNRFWQKDVNFDDFVEEIIKICLV